MKRLFSILSAAVMLLSIAAVMVYAAGDGKPRGDVNGDGKVDSADALLVMKYDAGLTKLAENEIKRRQSRFVRRRLYFAYSGRAKGSRCRDYGKRDFVRFGADNRRNNGIDNGKYHEAHRAHCKAYNGACNHRSQLGSFKERRH